MTQSRVKVSITIETKDDNGKLTKIAQWDIIMAAAGAVRAAIEQYVAPSQRSKACAVAAHMIRSPLSDRVQYRQTTVPNPFKQEIVELPNPFEGKIIGE